MGNYLSTLHVYPIVDVSVRSGIPLNCPPSYILKTCPATPYPLIVQLRHGCNMYGQLFLNPTFASHRQCVCKNGVSPLTSRPPLCQDVSSYPCLPFDCAAKAWMQYVWAILSQPLHLHPSVNVSVRAASLSLSPLMSHFFPLYCM
jgi:hypothetical protein